MKIAVVGATGLVGTVMLKVLAEHDLPITELLLVASQKSVGKKLVYQEKEYSIISMQTAIEAKPDIAIFSAGGSTSKEWAPKFAEIGCFVIDNSSAWRMDPDKRLIVPEINANLISENDKIIANPNCSTIQMVVALAPLHKAFNIKRLVISTYQSFTGTGVKAVDQYEAEKTGNKEDYNPVYPHPIFENCLPHCDVFFDNGYTKEEMKLVHETRKILSNDEIKITATAVRVPVNGGHSESVNVEFRNQFDLNQVIEILESAPGVKVLNDNENNIYPTPLQAKNKDEVFVGRIRRDESVENGLNLWIVSDNLRKGAATNAVQIAEYLIEQKLVGKQLVDVI